MEEKMPLYIAGGLALVITLWMASGLLVKDGDAAAKKEEAARPLFKVRGINSTEREIMRETAVHGRTGPDRQVELKAEVAGTVEVVGVPRGSSVEEGALVAALDVRDREARVVQARAALQQAQLEAEAARRLAAQGLQSESQAAAADATLGAAQAALTLAELDLARAQVEAPYAGRLTERYVEVGDYVRPGDPIADLLDLDPIVVSGYLTEREVVDVHVGASAVAHLSTGEALQGNIRYVSSDAEAQSRMFKVEMEAPNPRGTLRSGVTARLVVPHEPVLAHLISPAHLMLSDQGDVGVLLSDEAGVTRLEHVEVVKNTAEGIWVSGLPERVTIVTVGKDFVRPGEKVQVVLDEPAGEPAEEEAPEAPRSSGSAEPAMAEASAN